ARENRFQSAEEMRQAVSHVMGMMAPKADVERTAAFVRSLYENAIRDERAERDRLLAEGQALIATPAAASSAPAAPVAVARALAGAAGAVAAAAGGGGAGAPP